MTSIDCPDGVFRVYIEVKNADEHDPARKKLLSKGFFPTITVQDFPIRGHQVFLHIKCRRWLHTQIGKFVYRDWTQVADGTRMTSEFSRYAVAGFFKTNQWHWPSDDTNLTRIQSIGGFYVLEAEHSCANTVLVRADLSIGINPKSHFCEYEG